MTRLMTPPGRSEVSRTWYKSVAASGCFSEGDEFLNVIYEGGKSKSLAEFV